MTRSALLELVYQFYPRDMYPGDPRYTDTEQRRRQVAIARRAGAEYPKWQAMLDRLRARYSVTDLSLYMLKGEDFDSAYSAYVKIPGDDPLPALGFNVSVIGPYYRIQRRGSPGEEPCALDVTREIEVTYRHEPVPPEIGNVVVPDVVLNGGTGSAATIYTCVLSSSWGDGLPSWM